MFGQGGSGGRAAVSAAGDSLGVVDARSGRLVADTGVGATPTAVAAGEGAYWVTNADGHTVSRIDPGTTAVVDTIPVGNGPSGIAIGAGAVWVVNSLDGTVSRIDPARTRSSTRSPSGTGRSGSSTRPARSGSRTPATARSRGSTPKSGRPTETLPVAATELAFGAGTLWASERAAGQVVRIDPTTGKQVVRRSTSGTARRGSPSATARRGWRTASTGRSPGSIPSTNSVAATVGRRERAERGGHRLARRLGEQPVRRHAGADRSRAGTRSASESASGTARRDWRSRATHVLVAVRHSGAGHRGGTLVLRSNRARAGTAPSTPSTTPFPATRTPGRSCG